MTDFTVAINDLIENIKADYANWSANCRATDNKSIHAEMIERFNNGLTIEEGRKYIKVISDRSVWGFIMKEDDKKFRKGDILKAASWSAPARNKPRGNVLDGGYTVRWTGPLYL